MREVARSTAAVRTAAVVAALVAVTGRALQLLQAGEAPTLKLHQKLVGAAEHVSGRGADDALGSVEGRVVSIEEVGTADLVH